MRHLRGRETNYQTRPHASPRGRLAPVGALLARLTCASLAALALLALGAVAPAGAQNTVRKILETCSNGEIPTGYSQQAYNQALRQMPAELSEYSDCPSLIHKAQLTAAAGRGGAGGGPGGAAGAAAAVAPPTAAEQKVLEHAAHSGSEPVRVAGEVVHPGVVHVNIASAISKLPTPLLMLLAFLVACGLLVLGRAVGVRIRARRGGGV